ncbi:lysine exporter protein LysE/YggA [Novosphingobium nitrogenifigens DSM 19370]|uniref:Lysine exporter protein LysE/YggA n=1 Tax=Novosphingobium nitrogenifigens DSM 19370 TaxID=983920 RepID=F1ZAC2_9SPHN|nr:LysE family translocator [Novosphingobium nitrogenifigens]EGD58470.1 lysine exporter protein LysE/YggA [Novosphingobium nitrogenifigens DSM 19370]
MALHTWWLFIVTVFFISASPGPNMLHVMTRSLEHGVSLAIMAMIGCFTAVLCLLAASAAGLTAVLLAIPGAFSVMKILGAGYLVWLGYKAWTSPVAEGEGTVDIAPETSTPSRWQLFRTAFTISISNPKALVFAAAFLPLFLDPARPKSGQFAVMVATFGVVEFSWYFIYALGGRSLARWLQRPERRRLFNRVTGGVFVAFGLAMAGTRA